MKYTAVLYFGSRHLIPKIEGLQKWSVPEVVEPGEGPRGPRLPAYF